MRGGARDNYCGQQALEPVIPGFKPWVSSINYSPSPTIYGGLTCHLSSLASKTPSWELKQTELPGAGG